MNLDEAFIDNPPEIELFGKKVRPRPLSLARLPLMKAIREHFEEAERVSALVFGYAVINSSDPHEAARLLRDPQRFIHEVEAAQHSLADHDSTALLEYLNRVFEREAASRVEVPEGKSDSAQTAPAT